MSGCQDAKCFAGKWETINDGCFYVIITSDVAPMTDNYNCMNVKDT